MSWWAHEGGSTGGAIPESRAATAMQPWESTATVPRCQLPAVCDLPFRLPLRPFAPSPPISPLRNVAPRPRRVFVYCACRKSHPQENAAERRGEKRSDLLHRQLGVMGFQCTLVGDPQLDMPLLVCAISNGHAAHRYPGKTERHPGLVTRRAVRTGGEDRQVAVWLRRRPRRERSR